MSAGERFEVQIRIDVQKVSAEGSHSYGERFSVNESGTVQATTFADVAAILQRFHDLLTMLREAPHPQQVRR